MPTETVHRVTVDVDTIDNDDLLAFKAYCETCPWQADHWSHADSTDQLTEAAAENDAKIEALDHAPAVVFL